MLLFCEAEIQMAEGLKTNPPMICQAQNQKAVKMALANEKKTLHETFKN
jgi:hypothetical protein